MDVDPCALVPGFFLQPDDLCIREFLDLVSHPVERERRNLLQSDEGYVVNALVSSHLKCFVIDFSRAEYDPPHLFLSHQLIRVAFADHTLEPSPGAKVFKVGHRQLVAKQVFWRCNDQRLAEWPVDLSSEHVEVVGRCGTVDDLPVGVLDLFALVFGYRGHLVCVFLTHQQKPFQPARRVLGAHALVSVGKEEDQAGLYHPFVLLTAHELVEDHLCTVREIAELSFPEDELVL
mmetsp:Transcript_3612/g.6745  ORF Transcript_3612/g.6745 Transcript_3612/m.6745 type:complete len:233 (-) Transcript_3612:989-1687(-)